MGRVREAHRGGSRHHAVHVYLQSSYQNGDEGSRFTKAHDLEGERGVLYPGEEGREAYLNRQVPTPLNKGERGAKGKRRRDGRTFQ